MEKEVREAIEFEKCTVKGYGYFPRSKIVQPQSIFSDKVTPLPRSPSFHFPLPSHGEIKKLETLIAYQCPREFIVRYWKEEEPSAKVQRGRNLYATRRWRMGVNMYRAWKMPEELGSILALVNSNFLFPLLYHGHEYRDVRWENRMVTKCGAKEIKFIFSLW